MSYKINDGAETTAMFLNINALYSELYTMPPSVHQAVINALYSELYTMPPSVHQAV